MCESRRIFGSMRGQCRTSCPTYSFTSRHCTWSHSVRDDTDRVAKLRGHLANISLFRLLTRLVLLLFVIKQPILPTKNQLNQLPWSDEWDESNRNVQNQWEKHRWLVLTRLAFSSRQPLSFFLHKELLLHVHGTRRAQLGLLTVLFPNQITNTVQHLLIWLRRVFADATQAQ